MVILYLALLIIYIIFLTSTVGYKKNLRNKIKKGRLSLFFGMSMFIVDKFFDRFFRVNPRTEGILKKIHIKENVNKDVYLYKVEKISIALVTFLVFLILGTFICISEQIENTITINQLERMEGGGKYEFYADDGENIEKVEVEIEERKLTKEECLEQLEESREILLKEFLGENKTSEKITKPLNLCNEIAGTAITVSWDISDNSVIDNDGKILSGVSEDGVIVNITANMMLNDVTLSYVFPVNVYPRDYGGQMQEAIQDYVDSQSIEEKNVNLPKKISDKAISYYKNNSRMGYYVLPMGVAVAILMILLKDEELKKEEKKRDEEMQIDYPEIVSKILLYSNAGLSLKNTLERIVKQYDMNCHKKERYAYEELRMSLSKMKSGMSEINAINEYGTRCGIHNYVKLSNIIEQNQRRGTKELSYALENEVNQALIEKKNIALKKGSEISTKLLGPMIVMLIVALVIIMIPALMTINI